MSPLRGARALGGRSFDAGRGVRLDGCMARMIRQPVPNLRLTTYTFRVVVEPDGDAWHAYCPALKGYGAVTWGTTRAEALRHIREVVEMVGADTDIGRAAALLDELIGPARR